MFAILLRTFRFFRWCWASLILWHQIDHSVSYFVRQRWSCLILGDIKWIFELHLGAPHRQRLRGEPWFFKLDLGVYIRCGTTSASLDQRFVLRLIVLGFQDYFIRQIILLLLNFNMTLSCNIFGREWSRPLWFWRYFASCMTWSLEFGFEPWHHDIG